MMGITDWMMLEMPSDTLHTVGVGTGMEETQREASIVAIYGSVEDMVNSMLGRKWEYGFLEVPGQIMTHVRPGAMGRKKHLHPGLVHHAHTQAGAETTD